MKNLKDYPKEVQNLIISSYLTGKEDGQCGNKSTQMSDNQIIEYLNSIINPYCELTEVDSVS